MSYSIILGAMRLPIRFSWQIILPNGPAAANVLYWGVIDAFDTFDTFHLQHIVLIYQILSTRIVSPLIDPDTTDTFGDLRSTCGVGKRKKPIKRIDRIGWRRKSV